MAANQVQERSRLEQYSTILGKNTRLKGKLSFSSSIRIEGSFNGDIDSSGYMLIEKNAQVTGDIKVHSVIVAGALNGDVQAIDKVEIRSSGKVIGDINAARIRFHDGIHFEGDCNMLKDPTRIDIFSASVDKIKIALADNK